MSERKEPSLAFLGGDGYDRMEHREKPQNGGWKAIAGWGRDGWDLGDWPYVVVSIRKRDGKIEVMTDCEGDQYVSVFETREEANAHIDEEAFFRWRNHDDEWIRGIPKGEEPEYLRGPFSWARLRSEERAVGAALV